MSTKQTPKKKTAAKTAGKQTTEKPRHARIFDHSACAVARALGKEGVKWAEADAILRAHGVAMSKASLSVQLGFGRNSATWEKRGEPAPLTAAQIKELRKAAQA